MAANLVSLMAKGRIFINVGYQRILLSPSKLVNTFCYFSLLYAKVCSFHCAYNVIAGLTLQATLVL